MIIIIREIWVIFSNSHFFLSDLNSTTQFVVGLALCALGSICSPGKNHDF